MTRTVPRFSADYPPTLTAHDVGVKDLLDALYMQRGEREVVLYAITIDLRQSILHGSIQKQWTKLRGAFSKS